MEAAGHVCVGACEIDEYARAVYLKRFPTTEWFPHDITKIKPEEIPQARCWTAGFPCQDVSCAGQKKGVAGSRTGLFYEIVRLAGEARPPILFLENVRGLFSQGFGEVLKSLSDIGYHAEWETISARSFGAHHKRERVWIVAYLPDTTGWRFRRGASRGPWEQSKFERLVQRELQLSVRSGAYGRVSDGISNRVDRLRGLGNAVVPQVVEMIARMLPE